RWGNSIGIALPKDIIRKNRIKADSYLKIYIPEKQAGIKKAFGTLNIKEPTQEILDRIREGED
ncbi:hypothetical protein J4212_04020, partial [Candidatus Woesearchaeota archaeon]|nr:hypothetical protein [Candidatus Woesearchaeota archaeon]